MPRSVEPSGPTYVASHKACTWTCLTRAGQVDRKLNPLRGGDRLALPRAVVELRMSVAEPAHLELEPRLEHDGVDTSLPVDQVVLESVRPPRARSPLDSIVDSAHDLGGGAVGAGDRADLVPSPAIAVLVDVEVRGRVTGS